MSEIVKTKELFKCSKCSCNYYQEKFGLKRLGDRYLTCIKCRDNRKHKRKFKRSISDKKRRELAIKYEKFKCDKCGYISGEKGNLITHKNYHCNKGDDSKQGSAGEKFIKYILKKLDTPYLFDKPFDNLRSITDARDVRFDFILYSDTDVPFFIEYDGRQHFKNNWLGRDGRFETLQENDKIKDEYCEKNNYPMLRIKYDTPFDKIEDIIKEFLH